MTDIEAIRARCAQSVTEMVASPSEYFRVQQILRDRQDLLALVDETQNSASDLVEEVVALSVRNERIEKALRRALDLLRIGMDVGMEPHEKDEANALCVLFGGGESFTKALATVACPDCKTPTTCQLLGCLPGPPNPARDPKDGHAFWDPHSQGSCYSCGCGPDVHRATDPTTSPL